MIVQHLGPTHNHIWHGFGWLTYSRFQGVHALWFFCHYNCYTVDNWLNYGQGVDMDSRSRCIKCVSVNRHRSLFLMLFMGADNSDSYDHVLPNSTRHFYATSFITGNRLVSPPSDQIVSPPGDQIVSPPSDQIVSLPSDKSWKLLLAYRVRSLPRRISNFSE